MILSTRSNPPKSLNLSRPSTQKHLTVKDILRSPLPSPSLPSILPRHGKKPPRLNTRRILRYLFYTTLTILLYKVCHAFFRPQRIRKNRAYQSSNGKFYEIIAESDLPSHPTPIALSDAHGNFKWTISIPSNSTFPLSSATYADLCTQAEDVAAQVTQSKDQAPSSLLTRDYKFRDSNYIDIAEAKAAGLLLSDPPVETDTTSSHLPICTTSLTFTLDASSAGLGPQLLHLWLTYALAKYENRAFFIDDTNFAYGSFEAFFPSYHPPACRPPGVSHIVPWPRHAQHLVVSVATSDFMFGAAFQAHYGRKEVFGMMREGYEALWGGVLKDEGDEAYVADRVSELTKTDEIVVGLHVRRGDRRPFEFQYSGSYLPVERYLDAVPFQHKQKKGEKVIVASDDPDIYSHPSLLAVNAAKAQDRINLASKHTLASGLYGEDGWEGGFFRDVFWGLGLSDEAKRLKHGLLKESPRPSKKVVPPNEFAAEHRDFKSQPTPEALAVRELIARAYLMDLAVLSRASTGGVVCAVSASACRVLGVMMGWERMQDGEWWNVDGTERDGRGWFSVGRN